MIPVRKDFFSDNDRIADDGLPVMMGAVEIRSQKVQDGLFFEQPSFINQQAVRVFDPGGLDCLNNVTADEASCHLADISGCYEG